eukprot:TRINITY_DN20513_c0_g1_i1.p1 TRINITY_DN20513_c0_g1~~TRINITY_DN20513_c0_g1_i1.p1  ORF type:complete len:626 (+),score=85.94 TRINITY_DN20513_c0_g1_i1:180-2057(+)
MLGPTFVKLGQSLSVRPDVLSEVFLHEFEQFQDSVAPFDHDEAMQMLLEDLGLRSLSELFMEFGRAPVAAASLGQVYRARLTNGREVAVKIQRPRLNETVSLDVLVARQLAKLLVSRRHMLPKGLQDNDFVGFVDAFGQRLFDELNYDGEVKNAQRFQKLYGDQEKLKVPTVFPKLTTRRVITMEWIDGVKLTDKAAIRKLGLDPLDFITVNIECTMRQLLEHGYFHADPHPGNFFVTKRGELCVLDFGLMSEMPKESRLALIQHIVHVVNRDYEGMANDYVNLGFLSRDIDVRPIVPQLAAFFDPRLEAGVSAISFKTIVDGLDEVIFKNYQFKVPAFYALVFRSLVTLEGLALTIDPNYKVLSAAYPYVARRILLDAELRSSLVELLVVGGEAASRTAQAASFRWDRAANLLRESSKSTVAIPGSKPSEGRSDTALLLDLASTLVEDDAFRRTLISELASTADVIIADFIGAAVGRLVEGEGSTGEVGRRAVGLRGEDQERVLKVRETVDLLAEKVVNKLPSRENAFEIAMQAAASAASGAANQALTSLQQSILGQPQPEPDSKEGRPGVTDVAGEFFGQLGERAAVRTLKSLARLIGGEESEEGSDRASSSKPASGRSSRKT